MPKAISRKYNNKSLKDWLNIAKYKLWLQECPNDSDEEFRGKTIPLKLLD